MNDILSFCINDEDISFISLNKESVFLIGLNFEYNLKRVITHNDGRTQERIYVEIVDMKTDEEISMNVTIPKELEKETMKVRNILSCEGSYILLDYNEHNLQNYKFTLEHGQTVACKGLFLKELPDFKTIHDFTDKIRDIYVDQRINL